MLNKKDRLMTMLLTDVKKGKRVRFVALEGGHNLQGRLASMGLLPGAALEVIQNEGGGPIILSVGGSRMALGRGMACRILVA